MDDMVNAANLHHPDGRGRVNAAKYGAMKEALRIAMANGKALTQSEMREAAKPHLTKDLFPSGKTAGWGAKTIELDLEARGIMNRAATKPLKFFVT